MSFDFENANEAQKKAIKSTEGPLLIIAGPGTGKTYTLVKRIVYLIIEKNVKLEEIMVVTFTEKAAKELLTRITSELIKLGKNVNVDDMYIGTFHSICLRIIKEHIEYSHVKKNYHMMDQFDQKYMIFQHINRFRKLPHYDSLIAHDKGAWGQAGDLATYINNLLEELVDTDAMVQDKDIQIVAIAHVVKEYEKILQEENLLDFASIQTNAYHMLEDNPAVLESIRSKIKYIMVDEYQDTNYIQEKIVFLLAGEKKNICVVGDDDQGLYRFRGATIRNILEFSNKFKNGECKQINLVVNYRSEKQIIDFYNQWMNHTINFTWKNFRFPKEIVPGKMNCSTGTSVTKCYGVEDIYDWVDNIYKFIIELKNSGKIKDYNQVAFLCKSVKNKSVLDIIRLLEKKNIPVYSPRSEMFFEREEIRELLGIIIMCFPKYYSRFETDAFSNSEEQRYQSYYRYQCVESAKKVLQKYEDLRAWHERIAKEHSALSKNTDYGFTKLMYQILQFEPFCDYISENIGEGILGERKARNISILSAILNKFEYLHHVEVFTTKNIVDVVEKFFNMYIKFFYEGGITEYEDDSEYAPRGCISFMTIHQSKGMEFPIVMVDSLYERPKDQENEIFTKIEKRYFKRQAFEPYKDKKYFDFWRLYYTAFSRAQNLLVLTCNENFDDNGKWKTPSKFFIEQYNQIEAYDKVDYTNLAFEEVKPVDLKRAYSFTSHIELYENCALQYKFFKELGFTQGRVGTTLFGRLVHETIEDVHRTAMRHEEKSITPEKLRQWIDVNYLTLSKCEHSYLGARQIDVAYKQVKAYVERMNSGSLFFDTVTEPLWSCIQDAEVDVSLVKNNYILKGKVDLIIGDGTNVEIIDFKSEKKTNLEAITMDRYKRQLEIYAHLIEEQMGKKVSKMHLYYTGECEGNPLVTFEKSKESIATSIKAFDAIVEKIQNHEFLTEAKNKKTCLNCDMRYYCGKVKTGKE